MALRLQLMPIDANLGGRQLLRTRHPDECEPATWDCAPLAQQQVRLRSVRSNLRVSVSFKNATKRGVHLIWLDHIGDETILDAPSCTLEPGADSLWRSFSSHPWLARDATDGTRLMLGGRQAHVVVAADADKVIQIQEPPSISWTHQAHRHFPEAHRSAVRAVLLSHHRLQHDPSLSATAGPPPGAQPDPKRRRVTRNSAKLYASIDAAEASRNAALGLARLHSDLVLHIVDLMVPDESPLQDVAAHPHGHAGVLPALLDSDPADWEHWPPLPPPPLNAGPA